MKAIKRIILSMTFISAALTLQAKPSTMHPAFKLLDEGGKPALKTGEPVSTIQTCQQCHNADYIEKHNYHSLLGINEFKMPREGFKGYDWELSSGYFGTWSPLKYRRLSAIDDQDIDLGTVDWIKERAVCLVGGGPAHFDRSGEPFTDYDSFDPQNPETSVQKAGSDQRKAWNWHASGIMEVNCFLCHLDEPDNQARIKEIEKGAFRWVNTATLAKTGISLKKNDRWKWNPDAFQSDGSLKQEFVTIHEPNLQNCGQCHIMVHQESPVRLSTDWLEGARGPTGEVFSAERIQDSQVNIVNKGNLSRSWDIHAERLVGCANCHFSINNPAFYRESDRTRPAHLIFDGRKMSIEEFLKRPSHMLANMRIRSQIEYSQPDNIIHRCENCHDPYAEHDFLPYKKRHIWALGCESCHIPKMHWPGLQQLDWTTLTQKGGPQKVFRGFSDRNAVVEGYEPAWFTRRLADKACLLPYNLTTSFFWIGGEKRYPVKRSILEKVFLNDQGYREDIIMLLDDNKNGTLEVEEQALNTPLKIDYIKQKLAAQGVSNPEITGEIRPYSIHHGVAGRKEAIRDCYECHGSQSRFMKEITLASFVPGDITPKMAPNSFIKLEGRLEKSDEGSLVFLPKQKERGLYILGKYRNLWVDIIGWLAVLGVIGGVTLHGGLRILIYRRANHERDAVKYTRAYMYPVYERLWHWLQASCIIIFLITGLEIRYADLFPLLGYEFAVRLHEIAAYVFIGNALLSFAYHVTAGEIKNYVPQPRSFIDESWKQALFYLRGIFIGERHPLEKSPERRLNPLQQVTYLTILYFLIPVQAISGILIWGAERWPEFLESLGGLSVIVPIHTLCAWFFISFLIMHIYLTTTGETPLSNTIAMVTGWEEVELKTDAKGDK